MAKKWRIKEWAGKESFNLSLFMIRVGYERKKVEQKKDSSLIRLRFVLGLIMFGAVAIGVNLFLIMVLQHDFYTALAAGSHEMYEQLFPERGEVYMQDSRSKELYPLAINRDYYAMYVDTRQIEDETVAQEVAEKIAAEFDYNDDDKFNLYLKLTKDNDPYEPIEDKIDNQKAEKLMNMDLPGIGFTMRSRRFYPENDLAAHVIGFLGKNRQGMDTGSYGIEGYWDNELSGNGGFFEGFRTAVGDWIPLGGRSFKPAEDGVDLILTIDRTVQYMACKRVRQAMEEYGATSASLIIMDPVSGAIRAMCGLPEFDPNTYNQVESIEIFNNNTIFTPYEPGSIFKPITMAAAIEEGVLRPESRFEDIGPIENLCMKPINNAEGIIYGEQTMTQVLENSVNTGMVYVVRRLGKNNFIEYLKRFGFGTKLGIELDSEMSGTIDTLYEIKKDKVDCYTATASFGQGITATPLQMVNAFAVIANGGLLMRPYIVEEIHHQDGRVEKTQPREIKRILSKRTASFLAGMLVSVVDNGHASEAKVDGYYVAGKTGTAQIAGLGGYTAETNHSFVGFAPIDNPAFVMIVKFEKPQRKYASYTTTSVFKDIAEFLLKYYQVRPGR